MNVKKVFISGSISIKKLENVVLKNLDEIISKKYSICIGDAPGFDSLVQDYLKQNSFFDVTVYTISFLPRYKSSNNFAVKYIDVPCEIKKERERQTMKDKVMSEDSEFSFVVWNGKSKGSYANILRAIESKKYIKVYYTEKSQFLRTTKQEIDFVFRFHNGYSASEVVDYFLEAGNDFFKKTQDLNKYLLEKDVLKKDGKLYIPSEKFKHLMIVEYYQGKQTSIKFKNELIDWLEQSISKANIQGNLFG